MMITDTDKTLKSLNYMTDDKRSVEALGILTFTELVADR